MSDTDALIAFLRARLDEDEAAAHAATAGPWWYNPGKQWLGPEAFERYDLAKGEEFVGYGGPSPFVDAVAATGPANNPQSMADAAHIARHDPARVLREVEAKRRLLYQFEHRGNSVRATVTPSTGGVWDDLLRMLAAVYADHDDYRQEWTP